MNPILEMKLDETMIEIYDLVKITLVTVTYVFLSDP